MRKLIAAINMTLDGYCDHTLISPDDEIHRHYEDLLRGAGVILYGRTTYQLMQYWQTIAQQPTGEKAMDDFAVTMDGTPKLVFSHTLEETGWDTARLATKGLKEEVLELKQQPGNDIFVGSPGLIVQAANLGLIDEYQLCVHPVVTGAGSPLFKDIKDRLELTLLKTKTFGSGAVLLYYQPAR
jgi:dihydrofolate reductase